MTVLIAYGTIEGQTGKIAKFAADVAKELGQEVQLVDTAKMDGPLMLDGVTHVILAASVHERRHPRDFEAAVAAQRAELEERKTLMISVSMKVAFAEGQEDAEDYLKEMLMRTGLTPSDTALVAGAVRPSSYDYFQSEIVRHVVLSGQDVDPADGVSEFTDWDALRNKVTEFLES